MLLFMVVARSLGRIFRTGIGQLRQGALAIGEGDIHHVIQLSGTDELAEVAGAFNTMAARLECSHAAFEEEIAERTRVEDDLRLERRHLQDVQEQLGLLAKRMSLATRSGRIGVWEWSTETGQLLFDARMFELYEIDPLRAVSVYQEWRERVHPEDLEHIETEIEATLADRQQLDDEFRIVVSSGEIRHIKTSAFVERDAEGRAQRMVGVNWDISEMRANERALEEARRQAEEASLAKSEFVANMSHEIRTPMNAIVGMLYLLRRSGLNERQADYAGKMQAATGSLLAIIDDVLDFSKIEAGRLELESAPFRLSTVMDGVIDVVCDGARNKGLELVVRLPQGGAELLQGDRLRLGQVLLNLTGNAIKFTERGEIVVEVQALGTEAGEAVLRFSIRDTGIGMSSGQLARLFAPFTQADSSISRRYGGSGLGLTISRQLVELMGGTLTIESEPGTGTVCSFELSFGRALETAAEPAAEALAGAGLQGSRVLLVEDNAINQQIAREILAGAGILVEVAGTGEEAVELLQEPVPRYDAVLMDLHMPGMGGYAATRLIRSRPANRELPVIAMTADAMAQDLESCLAAGMNDHVAKPIDVDKLFATLTRWIGGAHPPRGGAEGDAGGPVSPEFPAGLPGIESAEGLYRLNGNARLYRQLLDGFAAGHAADATAVRAALEGGDLPLAQRLLHNLKGLAGNLGARCLAEAAATFEDAIKSQLNGRYAPLCGEIVRRLDEVVDGIRCLDREAVSGAPALPPVDVEPAALAAMFGELAAQLAAQATDAIRTWELSLAPALGGRVAARELTTIDAAIQSLDFEGALVALHAVGASLGLQPD